MSTPTAKKEQLQKRAILRDVLRDNLEGPQSKGRRVVRPSEVRVRHSRMRPVVLPVLAAFLAVLAIVSHMESGAVATIDGRIPGLHASGFLPQPFRMQALPKRGEHNTATGLGGAGFESFSGSIVEELMAAAQVQEESSEAARERLSSRRRFAAMRAADPMKPPVTSVFSDSPTHGHMSNGLADQVWPSMMELVETKPPVEILENFAGLTRNPEISLARLFGLGVKTIVIDPGHGGRDPGAIGPGGLLEKHVTLRIAKKLRERLEAYPDYRILMTRDSDVYISTRKRVEFANAHRADLFISIHVNSLEAEQHNVIETYHFGSQTDEKSLKLAEAENQGSEYLMAEFEGMIKKISDQFKHQESRSLALSIQKSLFRPNRRDDERLISRHVKTAPFVVLLGTDMPSVLAEIACISNPGEEKRLATSSYLENVASHLEHGIVNYLNNSLSRGVLTDGAKPDGKHGTDGKG